MNQTIDDNKKNQDGNSTWIYKKRYIKKGEKGKRKKGKRKRKNVFLSSKNPPYGGKNSKIGEKRNVRQ